MALQNIGAGNRDDAFYRYKMPRMITKIEGRGNGIKTNVVNMVEIAKALARPPSYTTKYFGCELGAQSKFDEKSGTSLVNGAHETAKLAGLLENFIKKYVQCYGCGNPETDIITTKAQMIILKCAACGFLSDVDMRDKLTAFIIKNPPEPKKGSKDKKAMRRAEKERLKEGEAADEEQKKLKKEAARKKSSKEVASKANVKKAGVFDEEHSPTGSHNCGNGVIGGVDASADGSCEEDDDGGDGEIQWQTDTSAEAAHQRIREQLSAVTAGMVMLSAEDDDIKSKSEVEKSRKKQGKADSNGCCSETNIEDEIRSFLKKGCSPSQLKDFVATLSSSGASSSPQKILNALFFSLFDTCDGNLAKEVGKKKGYLAAVVQSESSQAHLLCALESFCTKFRPFSCVNEAAMAVKALYDGDVVEEEIVLEWYGQGSTGPNKYDAIWKDVKPFVDWLQSAESESE